MKTLWVIDLREPGEEWRFFALVAKKFLWFKPKIYLIDGVAGYSLPWFIPVDSLKWSDLYIAVRDFYDEKDKKERESKEQKRVRELLPEQRSKWMQNPKIANCLKVYYGLDVSVTSM